MTALRVRGTLLPLGELVEFWVVRGRVSTTPVPGATDLGHPGQYVVPGLVDAHCHVGLGATGAVDRAATIAQAKAERAAGVLLVRDCGVPEDTHWLDERHDLPRLIRCGRHIARSRRYIRNYAVEVEPEDLVAEVERQALLGDGWVKVVGDWIDRSIGDLAPLWPADLVGEAVAAAHRHGARVTTHVFGEEAVADWVAAGVDCVEHGTGLTEPVIAEMAARGTVLVPTLVQIENFVDFAAQGEAKFPRYAAHMRELHRRRFATVAACADAGIALMAGSDAGGLRPHGSVADEVELLARVIGPTAALGAASWHARRWLLDGSGLREGPDLVEGPVDGASADLICFDTDPRVAPQVLHHPVHVAVGARD